MVTKAEKINTVNELSEDFSRATAVFTTDQLGLTVSEITELRNKIRPFGSKYTIAKNTLISKAAEGTDFAPLTEDLNGPTAVLFCFDSNDVEPASEVKTFTKDNEKVVFKGAYLDGTVLDADQAKSVAGLPSKDVLLSQIAGLLVNIPSAMAYMFDELSKKDEDQTKLVKEFIIVDEKADEAKAEGETEAKVDEAKADDNTEDANASTEEPKA